MSVHYDCAVAAHAAIQGLSLTGLASASVYLQKVPLLSNEKAMPACTVSTYLPETMANRGTNVRDDVGYPVTVKFFYRNEQGLTSNHARITKWREAVAKAFRNQRLAGVSSVATCEVQPMLAFGPGGFSSGYDDSGLTLRFLSREVRG